MEENPEITGKTGGTLRPSVSPVLIHHQEVSSFFSSYILGANVWIASNVTILPGVTIGDHSIIGAGSVVTKDIPPNVIAFGHPAEVHREITEEDEIFYDHGKRISEHVSV